MPLPILYDAPQIVAIDKPAGLLTIPGRDESDCAFSRLAAQLGLPCEGDQDPRVRVVHRLDKDTSGVLLFAKTLAAQRHLCTQFENHTARKEYLALVIGRPAASGGEVDAPLGPHPRRAGSVAIVANGKPAQTAWRVEEAFGKYTLVRVFPSTGRMHQIRVHLASIGVPLAVDLVYNRPANNAAPGVFLSGIKRGYRSSGSDAERPLIARLTLHAARLTFADLDGREITVESPLPNDFRALLAQLRKHDSV